MLIGIIADLHGNLEATRAVFKKLDAVKPDATVCLGDLGGYNANPNEVIDIVRERNIPTVMGNHDAAVCGLEEPWFFNTKAQAAIQWQRERLRDDNRAWLAKASAPIAFADVCLAVHGSPGNRDEYIMDWLDAMRQLEFLEPTGARICFFGHSHRASIFGERGRAPAEEVSQRHVLNPDNRYFINPGSVGQPRDRDPRAALGFFDVDATTFEFHRVEYDIETAARKVVEGGLPPGLASRLFKGR